MNINKSMLIIMVIYYNIIMFNVDAFSDDKYEYTTFAGNWMGNSESGISYADGKGNKAVFNKPKGIVIDKSRNIYVVDSGNQCIRKITPDCIVSLYAGIVNSNLNDRNNGSNKNPSSFNDPNMITIDKDGNLYVTDVRTLKKVSIDGVVSTIAGFKNNIGYVDGDKDNAQFGYLNGISIDEHGNIYVADTMIKVVRKINREGYVSTVAGVPANENEWSIVKRESRFVDGPANTSKFKSIRDICVSSNGNIFIADAGNQLIRKLDKTGNVNRFAGILEDEWNDVYNRADETVDEINKTRLLYPTGIAEDKYGNLFVTDSIRKQIYKITPSGKVTSIGGRMFHVGDVMFGRVARDGIGDKARFESPYDIAVDDNGVLYITDEMDNTIRVGRPVK